MKQIENQLKELFWRKSIKNTWHRHIVKDPEWITKAVSSNDQNLWRKIRKGNFVNDLWLSMDQSSTKRRRSVWYPIWPSCLANRSVQNWKNLIRWSPDQLSFKNLVLSEESCEWRGWALKLKGKFWATNLQWKIDQKVRNKIVLKWPKFCYFVRPSKKDQNLTWYGNVFYIKLKVI